MPVQVKGVVLVTLVAFLPVAVGCTSNEYVIPQEELARLAATPPLQRGARVRVVQELGDRRSNPVPMTVPAPPPDQPEQVVEDDAGANVQIDVSGGGSGGGGPRGGAVAYGGRAQPIGGGLHPTGGGHGGASFSHGGGGGGGGNGDAAIVVLIVVIAVVVAVGLVSSEGVRFDGFVAMSPAQPLHLRAADGREAIVPVGDLSPQMAAETVQAKVMDDEGYGISRLDGVPLDRRGGVFKLDSGTIAFNVPGGAAVGPAMDVQLGMFITRRVGLVVSLGLAGASPAGGGGLIPRHALGGELQVLPGTWAGFTWACSPVAAWRWASGWPTAWGRTSADRRRVVGRWPSWTSRRGWR